MGCEGRKHGGEGRAVWSVLGREQDQKKNSHAAKEAEGRLRGV